MNSDNSNNSNNNTHAEGEGKCQCARCVFERTPVVGGITVDVVRASVADKAHTILTLIDESLTAFNALSDEEIDQGSEHTAPIVTKAMLDALSLWGGAMLAARCVHRLLVDAFKMPAAAEQLTRDIVAALEEEAREQARADELAEMLRSLLGGSSEAATNLVEQLANAIRDGKVGVVEVTIKKNNNDVSDVEIN